MERSKIIIDLIRDNITIAQAMNILNLLLLENDNPKIRKWLDNEIKGYSSYMKVPNYRIINCEVEGTIRNGYLVISNTNIPIKAEYKDTFCKISARQAIDELVQLSNAEKENEHHNLSLEAPIEYVNAIAMIDGEITHSSRKLSIYAFTNILNKLKAIIIDILLELEKQYGNLDAYYIDLSDKKSLEKVNTIIVNILDKSITIGDNNNIKNSNVGDNNEN